MALRSPFCARASSVHEKILQSSAFSRAYQTCTSLTSISLKQLSLKSCCRYADRTFHSIALRDGIVNSPKVNRKLVTVANAEASNAVLSSIGEKIKDSNVRVRFAPSPTGNLHVGGARTALFNWLFAKSMGGKFILRIEDTDLERSTKASEEAVLRDLKWLGLDWNEGPDIGGDFGPYRQSERNEIYRDYVEKLLASGQVYRCFCTDEELDAMRADQEAKKLAPKYAGKWSHASEEEVEAELSKGTPFTYRFRVPQDRKITIQDLIRGEVSWNTDTLGDFVVLRSNGQPVYNFCVAVDDATMKISHVIRAEEHLPNTLRQALIYEALGFSMPKFGHVSLILAPDRSKLSKRHGATSVGQFKEMGYLPESMVNYLSLLGWNDGTEEEIFPVATIVEKFSIDRVTKSAAIFDNVKLGWMNGQHLRLLQEEKLVQLIGEHLVGAQVLTSSEGPFVQEAVNLIKGGIDLVNDSESAMKRLLGYPLEATLSSVEAKPFVDDGLEEVCKFLIEAYETEALQEAISGGHDSWKKWLKGMGKQLNRKGKRLFMPVRILLTGSMQGPDVGATLCMLGKSDNAVATGIEVVDLSKRISMLKELNWANFINNSGNEKQHENGQAEVKETAHA